MTQYFHGAEMRMDMGGAQAASVIMDMSSGMMTMLMPTQKAYMQYNMAQIAAGMPQKATTPVTLSQTGTETVAGIPCTDYLVTGGAEAAGRGVEICAAPGVPTLDPSALTKGAMAQVGARLGMNSQVLSAYQQLKGKGVLKVSKVENGTKTVQMVATKVDHTSPPASMFQVPDGYTKFQMPTGAGMPGMGGGPPKSP